MLEHLPSTHKPLGTVSSSRVGIAEGMEPQLFTSLVVLTACHRVLVPVSLDFEGARHTREYSFPHYLIYGTHIIHLSPFVESRVKE